MRKIFESATAHHGQGVTCAVLGPRTGAVLATGGRDKEICLWALTDKIPIHTLTGFLSQVECVLFSWNELEIAGGNTSGAVKIWDIRKGQTFCSFAGHRGKVKCLAQSQFEEHFWASGAFDGHVKLWDARSGQLIATYRGHSNKSVTCMEFSPDGRWVVTGGEDCKIKLWDIAAGKALAELPGHSGPLTAVQFHPNEYLLASSSLDKTVRFWDMETFECVSQSAPDSAGPVKCILFDPSGRCLYSASSGGGLRVLGWEPARLFDSESCPAQWTQQWQGITALAMAGSQQAVIAVCLNDENESEGAISAFSIDATRLRPIYASLPQGTSDEHSGSVENNNDMGANNPMRRSFHRPSLNDSPVKVTCDSDGNEEKSAQPPTTTDEAFLAFAARPKLNRSPPNTPVPSDPTTTPGTPGHAASDPNFNTTFTVVAVPPQRSGNASGVTPGRLPSPARFSAAIPKSASTSSTVPQPKPKTTATVTPMSTANPNAGTNSTGRKVVHEVSPQVRTSLPISRTAIPSAQRPSNTLLSSKVRESNGKLAPMVSDRRHRSAGEEDEGDESTDDFCANGSNDDAVSNLGRTFTLSPEDFLPKEQSSAALSATFTLFHEPSMPSSSSFGPPAGRSVHFASQTMTIVTEDDCLAAVEKGCRSMSVVLDHRQRTLTMCRTAWRNRGPIAAMELACQMNDPSVVVDLLNILNFRSNIWKLDLCAAVLPQLRQLLDSKYDTYVHTAVNSLRLVLRGFGQIIKNGLQAGNQVPSIGVDISQEERKSKCQKCYNELTAIRESVQRTNKVKGGDVRGGRNAHTYRELSLLMNSLDL